MVAPLPGVTCAVHAVQVGHQGLLACANRSQGSMLPALRPHQHVQAEAFGAQRAAVDVLCSDERADAFLEHDADKNVYGSFYHIREPSTRHLSMSFRDFAGCLTSWASKKLLVRVRALGARQWWGCRLPLVLLYCALHANRIPPSFMQERVMTWSSAEAAAKPEADVGPALQQDLQQRIHWPWLQVAHPSQASHSGPFSAVQTALHVQLMPGVASTYLQC